MAQYFEDWSGSTAGNAPTGWTPNDDLGGEYTALVQSDAGATGGKWLEIIPTDLATKIAWFMLTWDQIDSDANRANAEVEFRYKVTNTSIPNDHDIYGLARGADLNVSGSHDHYVGGNRFDGRIAIHRALNKTSGGDGSDFLVSAAETIAVDTWYRINFRVNGTTLEMRQWADSGSRPGTPDLSTTNSDVTAAGKVGLALFSSIDGTIVVDWVGVGTNGDAAPTSSGDTTAPTVSSAATDTAGDTVTVTFNEALDAANDTAAGEWTINVNASPVTINSAAIDTGSTTDVVIELASAVAEGDTVTADYSGTSLRDAAGNQVATFSGQSVTNNVPDTTAPTLQSATVDGTSLVLAYNEQLDEASVPATGDFTVTGGTSGAISVSNVAVSGTDVTLTLASSVQVGESVTLDYTSGANPIQDDSGNDAASLTGQSVTNNTADTLVFGARFDSENLHPTNSAITDGDTATPSVTIVPRATETSGSTAWRQFLFKLEKANGKQPAFTLNYADYVRTFPSDWRPWYTYDDPTSADATWTRWPSATTNEGTNLRGFDLGSAFTQDNVWLAFKPAYPLGRAKSFIDWLEANHPTVLHQVNASIDDPNRVAATVSSQTDELSRTVPAQPLYAYGLWDGTSYPSDGLPKRPVILAGGNHAGEHVGDHILEAFIRYLVSGTAQANALLSQYQFYVYPCVNPVGRWGGHQRGQWDTAALTKDPNRDWLDQTLESTQAAVSAFADDLSGRTVAFALTFHDASVSNAIPVSVYYASDMLSAYQTAYEAEVDSYAATDFDAGNAFTDGILEGHLNATYGCEHGYTPEAHGNHAAATLSEWTAWGEHFARALDDLLGSNPSQLAFTGNYIAETMGGGATKPRRLDITAIPWPPSPGDTPALVQRGLGVDASGNFRLDTGAQTGDLHLHYSSVAYEATADDAAAGGNTVTVQSTP